MRRFMGVAIATVLAIAMAGCASTGGEAKTPCEKCEYGYVYVGKSAEIRKHCSVSGDKASCCIKDGKMYDCSKNPMECPECAKNAGK